MDWLLFSTLIQLFITKDEIQATPFRAEAECKFVCTDGEDPEDCLNDDENRICRFFRDKQTIEEAVGQKEI